LHAEVRGFDRVVGFVDGGRLKQQAADVQKETVVAVRAVDADAVEQMQTSRDAADLRHAYRGGPGFTGDSRVHPAEAS
jgi:hypothetical protein